MSPEAQSTTMAMAVQLTLHANEATRLAAATEQPTATETASPSTTPEATNTAQPSPTPSVTPYPIPDWPLFRNGDSGPEVYAIQYLLRAHGHNLTPDGQFGPMTRQRVIAFQGAAGLPADGIVGPQTWVALINGHTLYAGNTGQAERALQYLLSNKFGYAQVAVNGSYDASTLAAVKALQSNYGLNAEGVVGPFTWQALIAINP
ncbi:MAG TPA: peptidoglycan-binding protein [Anaerolineales bacterium]|nr:peptidoglycan-binding protein [Anaerolineales bacterium]HRQ92608.1 peptidoglycan-binding protein [Anaerolineales bacterium]